MTSVEAKRERQAAIVEVLRRQRVETQDQLARELRRLRIDADQATISRDLRQLGVARVAGHEGRRYLPPPDTADHRSHLTQVLGTQLLGVEVVGTMVVLRTPVGAAPVVALAVDAMGLEQVAGTVAGDDTIFVQARSAPGARRVLEVLDAFRLPPEGDLGGWAATAGQVPKEASNGE